jgi:hypothetical protein
MENFKAQLLTGWTMVRIVRLMMSAAIIYMAISESNWLIGLLGAFVLYQVITNTGCCGGSCAMPLRRTPDDK